MVKERAKNIIDRATIIRGLRYAIIISLLISALIILYTLDHKTLEHVLLKLDYKYIALLFLLVTGNWVIAGLRIKFLVNTLGENLPLKDCIIIFLSAAFVSHVTPFATGGGPFRVYFLHKKGVNVGKASSLIVIMFLLRLFFLGLTTPIFIIFFNWAISPGVMPNYLFYLAFGFGVIVSISIILLTLIPGIMDAIFRKVFSIKKLREFVKNSHRAKRWLVKARKELREFRDSLGLLAGQKGRIIIAGLYTATYWSLFFMILPLILKGFGLEPNIVRSYIMQTILYLVLPYTPSPGASGVAEVGFASLFVSFIPGNFIGLVTFAWRFFTFYLVLLVGGIFAFREIGKSRGNTDA